MKMQIMNIMNVYMISGYIKIKIGCFYVVFCRKRKKNDKIKIKKKKTEVAQNDARADDKQGFFFTRLTKKYQKR